MTATDLKTIRCVTNTPLALARVENEDGAGGNDERRRTFSILAYTGEAVDTWGGKLVIDLAGMKKQSDRMPIYRDHDRTQIVGHSEAVLISERDVRIAGTISGVGQAAREVVALADNDFPWQASVGIDVDEYVELRDDETITVNGRTFTGPVTVVTASRLYETSFVPLGADSNTRGVVFDAAGKEIHFKKEMQMSDQKITQEQLDAAREEAKNAERTRVAELKAAFANDPAFALAATEEGLTVEAAKAKYADTLSAKVAELEKASADQAGQIEKLKAELAKAKSDDAGDKDGVTHVENGKNVADYDALVNAELAKGGSRTAAMSRVAAKHPELHAQRWGLL